MKQGQFLEDKLYPLLMELANQTADPMIMLDDTFHILIFNKHVETLFSFPAKKALGLTLNEMCALSNIKCFISDEIMKSLPTSNIPSLFHHKKILWQLKKIPVDNTNFFLLKANRRDEKYYLNEIFKLETLIENMPCNVYWVDKDCKMIGCNQNVLTMLNMTPDQFIGKTYEELAEIGHWPDGLAQMLKADDVRVMNTGIPIIAHEDPPIPHAGGGFSNFLTSRVPLLNKDGSVEGIAGISADVTLLKAARTKAEVANKAKTEFIANMSHDIRTPLSGVVGMSQLLVDSLQNKEQKQYAEWLHISGEQLLNLLNDILDMISAEHIDDKSLGIESFDLRQCIQDIAALERPTIHLKGIDRCAPGKAEGRGA